MYKNPKAFYSGKHVNISHGYVKNHSSSKEKISPTFKQQAGTNGKTLFNYKFL